MKNEFYIPFSNADPIMFLSEDNHILQSKLWENFQKSLGRKVIRLDKGYYSFLAIVKETPVGKYLFVPYGPYLANQTKLKPAVSELKKIAKKEHAIFIRIEPTLYLPEKTLRRAGAFKTRNVNPAETWALELPEKTDDLLKILPRRLRGYYNTYPKKGIKIIESHDANDISHLINLQTPLYSKKRLKPLPDDYLKAELAQDFSTLYLAEYETKIIAAVLVFDDAETRYYMQAASDKNYAKLNANGILTLRAIFDAHKKGLSSFDFWGIAPENAPKNHPWQGFTTFKKMFTGHEKQYSGTYDIPINPLRFLIYKIGHFLKRR